MIQPDYVERLELYEDGTYAWQPHPFWSRGLGRWGLLQEAAGVYRLCFENHYGQLHGNYLVAIDHDR